MEYRVKSRFTFFRTPWFAIGCTYGNTVYVVSKAVYFLGFKYWKPVRLFWEKEEADKFLKTLK